MQRVDLVIFASVACWIGSTASGGAQPTTQDLIAGALQACHDGRVAPDRATRAALYEKGQVLGEQAVAADEQSADAHFALFCNLGELMRIDGEMSLSSVFGFRRMMKELNWALERKPDHLDALSARGTLLVRLPSVLGGDPDKGEQLLRHVIQEVPEAVSLPYGEGENFKFEIAHAMECIAAGKLESDIMPLSETFAVMQTMDALRAQWGLLYEGE